MTEVVENQACSILNNVDPKDNIDINKITEDNLKRSSSYYVEHFKAFAIKTAQSTLEMCRVVAEAKKALSKDRFLTFCKDIGHDQEDATIRKYITIGNKYEQFIKYAELLPNSWTSIYMITQLPSEVFESFVLTGNSMANMKGEQIKQLIAPKKSVQDQSKAKSDQSDSPNVAANQDSAKTEPLAAADAVESPKDSTAQSDAPTVPSDQSPIVSAPMSASVRSDIATDHSQTNNSIASDQQPNNDSSSPSDDHVFAKQAISKVLETAKTSTQTSANVEDEFEPYSITIRFKKKLSVEDTTMLQEMLYSLSKKYGIEVDTKTEVVVLA